MVIVDTVNKQKNITNKTEICYKNPNWSEANQLAIYKALEALEFSLKQQTSVRGSGE